MFRRKTSRVRNGKRPERRLHLRVNSPRIVCFGVLRSLKSSGKFVRWCSVCSWGQRLWGAKAGLQNFFIDNEEFQLKEVDLETNGRVFNEGHFAEVTGIDPTASGLRDQAGGSAEEAARVSRAS